MAAFRKAAKIKSARGFRAFGLAATYLGTVVGAGFASGQEIWAFFARFGRKGLLGMVLAGILFATTGIRALALGHRFGPTATQRQILEATVGECAPVFDLVLLFFLVVLSGVMLAGAGAIAQVYGRSSWVGILFTAFLALLVIAADLPGIVAVNEVFVPFLVFVTITVALTNLGAPPGLLPKKLLSSDWGWLWAALLYASYNTTLALPVLARLGAEEPLASVRRAGALGGALGLTLLGGLIVAVLIRQEGFIARAELPMPVIAARMGKTFSRVYTGVLWAELFSTLVAESYAAAARLHQFFGGRRTFWAAAAMAAGIILARLGFARLVRTAYPAFGLLSLLLLVGLLKGDRNPREVPLKSRP